MYKIFTRQSGLASGYIGKILLIMRLTTVIFLASLIQVSAASFGQSITLKAKNMPLDQLLKEIRKQSGYDFYYDIPLMSKASPVTLDVKGASIQDVLDQSFRNQSLTYKIDNKMVMVKAKEPSILDNITSAFERINVRGKIVNENGAAMSGATIKVKGTNISLTTSNYGQFFIANIDDKSMLVISFIGYKTKEIKAAPDLGSVQMEIGSRDLEGITINKGYYTEKRLLSTGSVTKINQDQIERQPVSNPLLSLQGNVSGLTVTPSSGLPGASVDVKIRGRNSIIQGNSPYYVVDGVPYISSPLANNSIVANGSPLNYLNTSDIESIEILKDADALAIYGSRGANGAILITTKKGKLGQSDINLNFYQGYGEVPHFVKLLNTAQYLEMRNEALLNDNASVGSTNPDNDLILWDKNRYTNWQKELLGGISSITNAQASITGGGENTQFLLGSGYFKQTSVFPGHEGEQKGSLHFNINHFSPNKKLNVLFTGNYILNTNTLPTSDLTSMALRLEPNAPSLYDQGGNLNWENGTWTNPLAYVKQSYEGKNDNVILNSVLGYEILPGLKSKINLGFNRSTLDEDILTPSNAISPFDVVTTGNAVFVDTKVNSWTVEPQLDYTRVFGKATITGLLGTTFQKSIREQLNIMGTGYTNDAQIKDIKAATTNSILANEFTDYRYQAIFGRMNFNWDSKYILNLTGRRDGSSRFGPGKQYANFGALGIAWVFQNESFIKENVSLLSSGKIRASIGTTGNDQIRDYGFIDLWVPNTYNYSGQKGNLTGNLYNPNYAWEVNKKMEIALEFGLFKDKLNVVCTYYYNRSDNQLVGLPIPRITGFDNITANLPATVDNKGLEFELSSVNIRTNKFHWTSSANLTIPQNELVKFPGFEFSSYANLYVLGQPLSVRRSYDFVHVNPGTGDYEYRNLAGQLTSTPSFAGDRFLSPNTSTKFYGGLNNSFGFYGVTIDILLQFVNQTGNNFGLQAFNYPPGMIGNQPTDVLARWRKEGDNTSVQKYTQSFSNGYSAYSNLATSDKYIVDASFVRVKNLSLSYQIPESTSSKLKVRSLRFYAQAQNLFTLTKYKGLDPETQNNSLPSLRVMTVGTQITF